MWRRIRRFRREPRSNRTAPHIGLRHILVNMFCKTYLPKCETGGVLGPGRGPARRHAGARARSDAGVPQRGDAGLGRARVQPLGPLRDRRHAARPLPRRAGGDAPLPRQRHADAEEERRQRRHRRPTLRAAEPLSPSRPCRGALRRVGLGRRPPRRRAHRQCADAPLSAGQDAERQRPASVARAARPASVGARSPTARIAHPAAVAAPARRAVARRASARLSPQGRGRRRGPMNRKMLGLYGLKWNPFAPDVPVEALHVSRRIESFCWRAEQLVGEGGFALVTGAPGVGKSVTLRILADRLEARRDVKVGIISRPQSGLSDFYREMGDLFGVELSPHNRWAGAKVLRDRWQAHIDAALSRPVLIADEAQEMKAAVLAELRLLSSVRFDSHVLLTVVLAGDGRLLQRLRSDELSPLDSRCRVRLALERATPDELAELLAHALQEARS